MFGGTRTSFWTPTTPTPSHALRPSLSLHNLESKTFTEVLIPVIRPPKRHEVSPVTGQEAAAVKISPNFPNEKTPRRSYSVSDKNGFAHFQHKPTVPTVISPPAFRQIKNMKTSSGSNPRSPPGSKSGSPSPQAPHYKSFTPISRLSEISENVIFMECS